MTRASGEKPIAHMGVSYSDTVPSKSSHRPQEQNGRTLPQHAPQLDTQNALRPFFSSMCGLQRKKEQAK